MQTFIVDANDAETSTEVVETKNIRIQTPQPVIEIRTIQTEDLVSSTFDGLFGNREAREIDEIV